MITDTVKMIEKIIKNSRYNVMVFDRDGNRIMNSDYLDRYHKIVLENTHIKNYWYANDDCIITLTESFGF